jgi:hypothetical protein
MKIPVQHSFYGNFIWEAANPYPKSGYPSGLDPWIYQLMLVADMNVLVYEPLLLSLLSLYTIVNIRMINPMIVTSSNRSTFHQFTENSPWCSFTFGFSIISLLYIPSVCLVFSECPSVCGELATGRFHVAAVERSLAASSELELPRHLGGFLSGGTPKLSLPTMAVIRPPNPAVIRPWPLVLKPMVTGETIFGKSENPKWQNWLCAPRNGDRGMWNQEDGNIVESHRAIQCYTML